MTIDVYSMTGEKKGTAALPEVLFAAPIRPHLMHLFVLLQQANRRHPIAHVKTRGEVHGSTRKLYQQKGTGRARRGPIRSPLLKGGGKTFGPRKDRNFHKDMPKRERRLALLSCLSLAAKEGKILGLERYGEDPKTRTFMTLLRKLPVTVGRRTLIVLPAHIPALECGARNVGHVKTLLVSYMNPEDILSAHRIIFLLDALKVAEETFAEKKPRKPKSPKNPTNNGSLVSLVSSDSLVSSSRASTASKNSTS